MKRHREERRPREFPARKQADTSATRCSRKSAVLDNSGEVKSKCEEP